MKKHSGMFTSIVSQAAPVLPLAAILLLPVHRMSARCASAYEVTTATNTMTRTTACEHTRPRISVADSSAWSGPLNVQPGPAGPGVAVSHAVAAARPREPCSVAFNIARSLVFLLNSLASRGHTLRCRIGGHRLRPLRALDRPGGHRAHSAERRGNAPPLKGTPPLCEPPPKTGPAKPSAPNQCTYCCTRYTRVFQKSTKLDFETHTSS